MPPRTTSISKETGEKIRERRCELGYTVEEAAAKAGVSPKTWSRYEAGGSVRVDKLGHVLGTLNWKEMPGQEVEEECHIRDHVDRNSVQWRAWIAGGLSEDEALALYLAAEELSDELWEALDKLSGMSGDSHIGQVSSYACDHLAYYLPKRYLTRYGYEFLFEMKNRLDALIFGKLANMPEVMHSCFFDDVVWYVLVLRARLYVEMYDLEVDLDPCDFVEDDFVFEDLETLFDDAVIPKPDYQWHFDNWSTPYEAGAGCDGEEEWSPPVNVGELFMRVLDEYDDMSDYYVSSGDKETKRG